MICAVWETMATIELTKLRKRKCWLFVAESWLKDYINAINKNDYKIMYVMYNYLVGYIWGLEASQEITSENRKIIVEELLGLMTGKG
ncbi:MAG: hypothetical protein HFI34_09990 [Lachnospiraceae bacterium]|nr:hypothetical protein [Lachnospiraceae bacterium]